jgi:putative membrane protein
MLDFATTDLTLAIAHHLLIFLLAGILAFEIGVIRLTMTATDIVRVARVDIWYGILAALIIVVGFSRAILAKIACFAVVGLLSIMPTMRIIQWRRTLAHTPSFAPASDDIRAVRHYLWAEVVFFAFIPAFAAVMARGYGSLSH